jgi:uncharacterized membrane-anchored protein YhcB (DUF1043 family)
MDWIVGALLLIVGVIIGFFLSKYWLESKSPTQDIDDKEETAKQLMIQQTAQHIVDSRNLVSDVQYQCDMLQQKINEFEELTRRSQLGVDNEKLEFFGGTTDTYLSHQQPSESRKKVDTEYQPRDYANAGSGLFAGEGVKPEGTDNLEKS